MNVKLKLILLLLIGVLSSGRSKASEIWFLPRDNETQKSPDFARLFGMPFAWSHAAKKVRVMVLPAGFLLRATPSEVKNDLLFLRTEKIQLGVGIEALPTDKNKCGDGVEGMVWPGEVQLTLRRLKDLGAEVDFFAFDVPFTAGHLSQDKKACHLSVREAAHGLAISAREIGRAYPNAKLLDMEVPTGVAVDQWTKDFTDWLDEFKRASNQPFEAVILDVWWDFKWQDVVRQTSKILKGHGVKTGVFIDSTGGNLIQPEEWISASKRHVCEISANGISPDFLVVANWLDERVTNLPETSQGTLTYLINWISKRDCQKQLGNVP